MFEFQKEIISDLQLKIAKSYWSVEMWEDIVFLRNCTIRLERSEEGAWEECVHRIGKDRRLADMLDSYLLEKGFDYWFWNAPSEELRVALDSNTIDELGLKEIHRLLRVIESARKNKEQSANFDDRSKKAKSEIMYVEAKPGLTGPARIGRVELSKTGKTIYYNGQTFQSLKGGYKCNYRDIATNEEYWISRCRKDGQDTLYPGVVKIDEDVREEYWLEIRKRPDLLKQKTFKSLGKYRH